MAIHRPVGYTRVSPTEEILVQRAATHCPRRARCAATQWRALGVFTGIALLVVASVPALPVGIRSHSALGAQDADSAASALTTGSQFATALLHSSETERISCDERRSDRMQTIQRRGEGWYSRAWDDAFPVTWEITLVESQRTVTLGVQAALRPRQIVVQATRPDSSGGGLESVRVRYRVDGSVQDGGRAVTGGRAASLGGDRIQRGPLTDADGILAFSLARELAFRCASGLYEALPVGSLWVMMRPD